MFMLGLGSLLAPLNLFVRDAIHLVAVALTAWMFATPIFYPSAWSATRATGGCRSATRCTG
jgi:ABC-2 type transport system permease protein